jgi:flagellar hook-length control protein FliK
LQIADLPAVPQATEDAKPLSEREAVDDKASSVPGYFAEHLQVADLKAVPQATQDAKSLTNNAVTRAPGMEPPAPPRDTNHNLPDNGKPLLSVLNKEDAPKDGSKAEQVLEPLPNSNRGKKNFTDFTVPMPTEKAFSDRTGRADNPGPDEKKIFNLLAQAEERDSALPPDTTSINEKKEGEGAQGIEEKNAGGIDKIVYPFLVQHDASAVQPQTYTAGIRGMDSTEGSQHTRLQTTDPVEQHDNTVSIIKEGTRLAVRLEPEGLGKLDINVNLKNGMVHTQISVHDDATKNLIDNNMHQIMDTLLKAGLSVGGFSVSLHKGDVWEQAAQNNREQGDQGTVISSASVAESARAAVRGLVNIFV